MGCCKCKSCDVEKCISQLTSNDIAELAYIKGLDINLCEKYGLPSTLTNCQGEEVPINTEVVTCVEFLEQLCLALASLPAGAVAVPGVTQLIGNDCLTHTLPAAPTLCDLTEDIPVGAPVVFDVTPLVGADCQSHTVTETPIVVVDTPSVNLTASGAYNHTLQADVVISPDANNILEQHPNGLYVPSLCESISDTPNGPPITLGVTRVVTEDCTLSTVPATVLSVTDTNTVDMTIVGAPGSQIISAEVLLNPDPNNLIQETGSGLLVLAPDICDTLEDLPTAGDIVPDVTLLVGADCQLYTVPQNTFDVDIIGIDSECIDINVAEGPDNVFQISGSINISADANNGLSCQPDGLFAPDFTAVAVDTSCIDMTVTEAPAGQFNISASPIISPDVGNSLVCQPNGLYVPVGAGSGILAEDTDCISMSAVEGPPGTFTISGTPILDPDICNGLTCTPDGLFTPFPKGAQGNFNTIGAIAQPPDSPVITLNPGDTFVSLILEITATNPSPCAQAVLTYLIGIPAVNVRATTAAGTAIQVELYHSYSGAVVQPVQQADLWQSVITYYDPADNFKTGWPTHTMHFVFGNIPPSGVVSGEWYMVFTCLDNGVLGPAEFTVGRFGGNSIMTVR